MQEHETSEHEEPTDGLQDVTEASERSIQDNIQEGGTMNQERGQERGQEPSQEQDKEHGRIYYWHDRRMGLLFKILLITYSILIPLGITWAVWVTSGQFRSLSFENRGGRFTDTDGMRIRADCTAEHINMVNEGHAYTDSKFSDSHVNAESVMSQLNDVKIELVRQSTLLERLIKDIADYSDG